MRWPRPWRGRKTKLHALDPADQQRVRRRAPGRVDRDPLRLLERVDLVEARAADDPDRPFAHDDVPRARSRIIRKSLTLVPVGPVTKGRRPRRCRWRPAPRPRRGGNKTQRSGATTICSLPGAAEALAANDSASGRRLVRHRPDRDQRQRLADHPRRPQDGGMSEWTIGIIGGSGLYEIDALEDAQWIAVDTPWGAPSDALLIGRIAGVKFVFLAPPRPRPPDPAERSQFPRQYRRAEAGGLHRHRRHLGGRLAARGAGAGPLRRGRPVHRPNLRARNRASSAPASPPMSRWPIRSARAFPRWRPMRPRRRAPRSRAAAAISPWRARNFRPAPKAALYRPGARRDRDDRHARGEARPRGRAALRARSAWSPITIAGARARRPTSPQIVARLHANAGTARRLIVELAGGLPKERAPSPIDTNLDAAIITAPEARDPAMLARLDAICGRVLGSRHDLCCRPTPNSSASAPSARRRASSTS